MAISRRHFIQTSLLGLTAAALPMRFAYAVEPTGNKLIVMILRGALDGLAAVPAYGDSNYTAARNGLAFNDKEGLRDLDGFFALHPSLEQVHALYHNKEAAILHACATPYRERSHFDGQDVLENGMAAKNAQRSGWLNRAMQAQNTHQAVAISSNVPLILEGKVPASSWSFSRLPDVNESFYDRLQRMYVEDGLIKQALSDGMAANMLAGNQKAKGNALKEQASAATKFLKETGGPDIAVLEKSGWDTHANQGTAQGQLSNMLKELDMAIAQIKQDMGPRWKQTTVLVMTEFGRTVAMNGTKGTDHGTGSMAILAGGGLEGGRMLGEWPGLAKSQLYQGRDLAPANDVRLLSAMVLHERFAIAADAIQSSIFPGLRYKPLAEGLFT